MKILYAASEVEPFSKTGGLADVAGALPQHVRSRGHDIRIAVPLYRQTRQQGLRLAAAGSPFSLALGAAAWTGHFSQGLLGGSVPVYFVDCDGLYGRDGLYGTAAGDYPDNAERFIFFCRAVLELCRQLDFIPDIVHCNDWQTGLMPAYIRAGYGLGAFERAATVFTIHNIAYQGLFPFEKFALAGLPDWFYSMQGLEYWGQMSMIKAGIVFSGSITTVSPQYAREIQTPQYGCGLEGILQSRAADLSGILNGADYTAWNPQTDRHIAANYTGRDPAGKRACKRDLLQLCGLPESLMRAPLAGSISRLVDQKGFDLTAEVLDGFFKKGGAYVLLGTGDPALEAAYRKIADRNSSRMRFFCAYDDGLAHKIEAGCDLFLMPSQYEPCGLNQIYSLKYGTVPVVRATGGLADTIADATAQPAGGTGFVFAEYSPAALADALDRALAAYRDRKRWRALMAAGMACDFSWDRSAAQYLQLYERAAGAAPGRP